MAGRRVVGYNWRMQGNGFADELRRIRTGRRLSQLDLAVRAGTTQRHLSFIERGRSVPGRDMVVRLAESLDLSLRSRNALLLAAGYAPVYPQTSRDHPALRPVIDALQHLLDAHLPYPAIVVDRYGDLIRANAALGLLTDGVARHLLRPPVNVYRLALHPEGMAARIDNLTEWARHILAQLHRTGAHDHDERLTELAAELAGYLPPDTAEHDVLGFAVPLRLRSAHGPLRLLTTITTFATATDVTLAELRLEAFLPADERTAAALARRSAPAATTTPSANGTTGTHKP
jgi:transcriptional regulator with XRE-family HTH domain